MLLQVLVGLLQHRGGIQQLDDLYLLGMPVTMQRADPWRAVEGLELQRIAVFDGEALRLDGVIAAGASRFVEVVLGRQRAALHAVVGELLACPGDALSHEETPQAAIGRLHAQSLVRAEADFLALMVGPDFQQILLPMQALTRYLKGQTQHAQILGMTLHAAQLDETQRPRPGFTVDRQWRQAQQTELLGRQISPGMRDGRFVCCGGFGGLGLRGWVLAHGRPVRVLEWSNQLSTVFLGTGANEGNYPFAQRTGQG